MSKTIINRIGSDGEISVFEVYVNDYEPIYNLTTSLMLLHRVIELVDKEIRVCFRKRITISNAHAFFQFEDDIYIVKL